MVQENSVMKQKLLIICGPTAVGKTSLGIECAQLFDGEIISADCMQIYKKLDIGTAKATSKERELVKHHLIDIFEPTESFSVGDFKELATKKIHEIWAKKKLPIVVGGTGFYIESLLFPYSFGNCTQNLEVREKYNKLLEEKGKDFVFNALKKVDPVSAQKLHPNDTKRVIRALEIYETTGKPKSQQNTQKVSEYDYKLLLLNCDRSTLYDRINKRVDTMLESGLESEVKNLIQSGLNRQNQSMQGIGYKEFFDFFENKLTYEQTVDKIKQNSRNYAKRQRTWFRHMQNCEEVNILNKQAILGDIKKWLEK